MHRQLDNVVIVDSIYRITLDSVTINDENGQQTWTYIVEELENSMDISNWALEICEDATVVSSTEGAEVGPPGGGEGNCLNGENCSLEYDVLKQIKWAVDDDFTIGTFEFTLDRCYPMGEVYVAIKTGGTDQCFCSRIQGPVCGNCPPIPGRGILFI